MSCLGCGVEPLVRPFEYLAQFAVAAQMQVAEMLVVRGLAHLLQEPAEALAQLGAASGMVLLVVVRCLVA